MTVNEIYWALKAVCKTVTLEQANEKDLKAKFDLFGTSLEIYIWEGMSRKELDGEIAKKLSLNTYNPKYAVNPEKCTQHWIENGVCVHCGTEFKKRTIPDIKYNCLRPAGFRCEQDVSGKCQLPTKCNFQKPADEKEFLLYIQKEKDQFVRVINSMHWNRDLRTASESLIIALDQLVERYKEKIK